MRAILICALLGACGPHGFMLDGRITPAERIVLNAATILAAGSDNPYLRRIGPGAIHWLQVQIRQGDYDRAAEIAGQELRREVEILPGG